MWILIIIIIFLFFAKALWERHARTKTAKIDVRKALWLKETLLYPLTPKFKLKCTFSQLLKENCLSKVVRIGNIIIFHVSKSWKAKFIILCDVIFLMRLQGKFEMITLGSERVKLPCSPLPFPSLPSPPLPLSLMFLLERSAWRVALDWFNRDWCCTVVPRILTMISPTVLIIRTFVRFQAKLEQQLSTNIEMLHMWRVGYSICRDGCVLNVYGVSRYRVKRFYFQPALMTHSVK